MARFLVLFILAGLSGTAQAAFTKGEICGGLLLKFNQDKKSDMTGLDPATQTAYQSIKAFRKSLGDVDSTQWNFYRLFTHSEIASRDDIQDVAGRIRGIEKSHEENALTSAGTKYATGGIQIRGQEKIAAFFLELELQSNHMLRAREHYLKSFLKADSTLSNTLLAMVMGANVLHIPLDPGISLVTSAIQTALLGMYAYQNLIRPIHPIVRHKVRQAEKFTKEFEKVKFLINSAAKSQAPSAWVFWSESMDLFAGIPQSQDRRYLQRSKQTRENVLSLQSYIDLPLFNDRQKFISHVKRANTQIDFLLHFDGTEPVLDVFLRMNVPLDLPSGGKKKEDLNLNFNLEPALQPATIPVKN